jgi:hypothetical protein
MIDFIKVGCELEDISEFVETHKHMMKASVDLDHWEVKYPYTFTLRQYSVKVFELSNKKGFYIEVSGSLHKGYFGGPNYERFTHEMLCMEIERLSAELQLEAQFLLLKNLEVGVNIRTHFYPYKHLVENLLLYKTGVFKPYNKGKDGKELGYWYDGYPIVKLYDKGKQFDLPYNLMRFELRYLKSVTPKKYGLFTLDDLKDAIKVQSIGEQLISAWFNVLLYEPGLDKRIPSMCKNDLTLYQRAEHIKTWQRLIDNQISRMKFYRDKERLKEIYKKCGVFTHEQISKQLKEEIQAYLDKG